MKGLCNLRKLQRTSQRYGLSFALLIDSEELASKNRGAARDNLFRLAARLANHLNGRPIAFLRTKADYEIPTSISDQIMARLTNLFPNAPCFEVSAKNTPVVGEPAQKFLNVLSWFLQLESPRLDIPKLPIDKHSDPFLTFRGGS